MGKVTVTFVFALLAGAASAQERITSLSSDPSLVESGLWEYVLPRFRLKTQVSVEMTDAADMVITPGEGRAVFVDSEGVVFAIDMLETTDNSTKFFDWLTSDIGVNTVTSYQPDGVQIYFAPQAIAQEVEQLELPGDPVIGKIAAQTHCGRCHVVSEENRFRGISSTPSFMALRTFDDWYQKFEVFWTLNPHPVFVQIDGITPDFNPATPPPIHPVFLTLDDVENIGAYLVTVEPADLGAPIEAR